jgi:hypothetical protein
MKISGFTMVKNADKLYYPIVQSITSILPIVDEFIVALGDNDPDDQTLRLIESIGDEKIKIIHTIWDTETFPKGTENAHQTDIAKSHCSGDWLFYLQADEVIHEKYLEPIYDRCLQLLTDEEVEGLIFRYVHFWGDYQHYHVSHNWYRDEIRIIRNLPDIHSWRDAQSFRIIPDFNGLDYRQLEGTSRLKAARVNAEVFHYGWVRPPYLMRTKSKVLDLMFQSADEVNKLERHKQEFFDYGPLQRLPVFKGTHPKVMKEWIERFDWSDQLQYSGGPRSGRVLHKHERLKYRLISFFEQNILGGRRLGGFNNFEILDRLG